MKGAYDRMLQYLDNLVRERFSHIREQLAKIHSGVDIQEAISTYSLTNDPTLKELSIQKFKEVTESELAAEREMYIERLIHEITTLNEKLVLGKQDNQQERVKETEEMESKKRKYKNMVKQFKINEESLKTEIDAFRDQYKRKEEMYDEQTREFEEYKLTAIGKEEKMKMLQKQIQELKTDLETKSMHNRRSSNMSDLTMFGQQTGINITALPANEVENMKSKIQTLKDELREFRDRTKIAEDENLVLKMNAENMQREMERMAEDNERNTDSYRIDLEQKTNSYNEKIRKTKERHANKLEKLSQQFQKILQSKVEEIQIEADSRVTHAMLDQKKTRLTLENKRAQIEDEYIKIKDHEAIMNEKLAVLKKSHEVEILSKVRTLQDETVSL